MFVMAVINEYGGAHLQNYPTAGLNRPLGLQEIEVTRIARQSALELVRVVKVVSHTHRPTLPTGDISVRV
jgi:hypothetical protein